MAEHKCGEDWLVIPLKPLSVNEAWQGKRYKSKKYKAYCKDVPMFLPSHITIPKGQMIICFDWYFSSGRSDWDNPIKPLQDIICSAYGLEDNNFYRAIIRKHLVDKGDERSEFRIHELTDKNLEIIDRMLDYLE